MSCRQPQSGVVAGCVAVLHWRTLTTHVVCWQGALSLASLPVLRPAQVGMSLCSCRAASGAQQAAGNSTVSTQLAAAPLSRCQRVARGTFVNPSWWLQVAVNLYPFRATVTATPPPSFDVGVENIDIGGPAMIRAAAKNHAHVAVAVDPADYGPLLEALGPSGSDDARQQLRRRLAWKAFQVRAQSAPLSKAVTEEASKDWCG